MRSRLARGRRTARPGWRRRARSGARVLRLRSRRPGRPVRASVSSGPGRDRFRCGIRGCGTRGCRRGTRRCASEDLGDAVGAAEFPGAGDGGEQPRGVPAVALGVEQPADDGAPCRVGGKLAPALLAERGGGGASGSGRRRPGGRRAGSGGRGRRARRGSSCAVVMVSVADSGAASVARMLSRISRAAYARGSRRTWLTRASSSKGRSWVAT